MKLVFLTTLASLAPLALAAEGGGILTGTVVQGPTRMNCKYLNSYWACPPGSNAKLDTVCKARNGQFYADSC
ncbi:hypothetical protein PTNB85_10303 [Pyrenophora teres f. teres]|nr:hypothetical protein PTNB85_10303 [Pyrenophora teres f. teres]